MNHEGARGPDDNVPGIQAEIAILLTLDGAPDDDARARIELAYQRWGAAFAAFLHLPDTTPYRINVDDQFFSCYAGEYEDERAVIDQHLLALGWTDALERLRTEQGIPAEFLAWDYASLDAHMREMYDTVPLDGRLYLFHR